MQFLEYPYVIITILVVLIILMGAVCLYYSHKCVKTAKGSAGRNFLGINKLKTEYEKMVKERKSRTLIYIGVSLDSMSRLYSESKAMRILSEIRRVLLDNFMDGDNKNISVYGEKSFVAVVKADMADTERCIEKSLTEINKILAGNEALNIVRMNFGIYDTSSTQLNFDTAVSRAKQACTIAEDKNVPYFEWDNYKGKELEKKIKIENKIQNEIDNNRFFLEYQPFIDIKTDKIIGAEVLSRLNSQGEGILTPGAFLSAVNNVGINDKFDYYIFDKTCKWIANNKSQREKCFYTINFSRSTICDEDFAERIGDIIDKYSVNCSSLAVEILEDKCLTDAENAIMGKNLSILREKGIRILLDDFGGGYTSFNDLGTLGIDIVKIDKSIVHNAVTDTGYVILKNIIQTAKDLGYKTVCEGIETEEHKKLAKDAGCDIIQGYYCYRPMPVLNFENLIED